jgi:hypothetical protein
VQWCIVEDAENGEFVIDQRWVNVKKVTGQDRLVRTGSPRRDPRTASRSESSVLECRNQADAIAGGSTRRRSLNG